MMSRLRALLLLVPVLALAGCSAFAPRLETPKLSIVSVELVKGELFEQRLRARMRVQNPNDRELAVKGITYTIELGGEELGRGLSGSSFIVNLAGTLLKLAGRAEKEGRVPGALDYRIVGKVQLSSGLLRSVPFDQKGTLRLR
jgi:LEA14-like dessication related protein